MKRTPRSFLPSHRVRIRRMFVLPAAAALAFATALGAGDAKPERKPKAKPGPQVLVVADAPFAVDFPRPTADRPVHYIIFAATEHPLGGPFGRDMPTREQVEQMVKDSLASQGYIQTEVGGPMPELAILIAWGEARLETWEYQEMNPETAETTNVTGAYNLDEIRQLLGIDKAEERFMSFSESELLNTIAQGERLYAMVAALDAAALRRGERKLVWRVRMSIGSERASLPAILPVMLASAASYFGREVAKPVFVNDALRREARVTLGELKVIEDDVPAPNPPPREEPR